jgi:hypothetical protein
MIKKDIDNIKKRGSYRIIHTIEFINDTDFNCLFNVYQNNKKIKTYKIEGMEDTDFNELTKKLEQKYDTQIEIDYNTLSVEQLRYLAKDDD